MIRGWVEKLARGRSFKRSLTVADSKWPIHVTPDAQLKYLKPGSTSFDHDLVQFAEQHVGNADTVWDIGANVGTFAVAAAAMAQQGSVLAVEADIWLAQLLHRTANEAAYGGRIEVLPVALSDQVGTARFLIAARGRASNALEQVGGHVTAGGVREIQTVPTLTLDILAAERGIPDLVKIDVEVAELAVLSGGQNLIQARKAKFYIELGLSTFSGITKIMTAGGYRGFDPVTLKPQEGPARNILFLPKTD